ncbi:TonB-dependent siderophore receptor [Pseudomonas cremoricolorata]|uniref:Ferric-pseudobactin BN7/BN8 receptor n=1 Tax=Pseudomonas cremoricolorata TaxID=157783 RepID=A0A089WFS9_9PSED|nr:TonB-dependent receptor [Pseudomonas cremoricolorata]AIR88120.1 ferric-pseudobactin BN7/BN8 receptor [Pseudomonas cremoricolorata]
MNSPTRAQPHSTPRSLCLAIRLALFSVPLALPASVLAEQTVQRYDIAPGPLGEVLSRYAQASGAPISFQSSQVYGLSSPGVRGSFTVDAGFAQALSGSGLVARASADGYQIEPAAPIAGVLDLGAIAISGKAPGSITEGTGSYTSQSSSSSTRLNIPIKETPQSISVVTQQRMQDQRLTNLTDALEATSGITVVREGLGADTDSYYSRGFAINNYEIDGVPTSSRLDNYTQNTAMYDRIEVVRGATGLISGMGEPSATINLIRKRPTFEPQLQISAEAGNWDRYGSTVDVSGPLTASAAVRGRLVLDYNSERAWVDRYKQDSNLVYGISEFDLSENTLLTAGFSYLTVHTKQPPRSGFPLKYSDGSKTDFKRSFNTAANWNYYDHRQTTFFTSLEHTFDNGWSGKVEYSHNENQYDSEIVYFAGDIDRTTGLGAYVMPNKFKGHPKQDALDAYLTGPFQLLGREHELITGVTLSHLQNNDAPDYGGWIRPGGDYDGTLGNAHAWRGDVAKPEFRKYGVQDFEETQYAAYLTSRLHLTDDLTVILGGRVIDWKQSDETRYFDDSYYNKVSRKESGVFIPYGGVVYDLDDTWSVYASYTKIFNPQSLQTTSGSYLSPLEGTGYETGIKAAFNDDTLNARLALFKLQQDNLAVMDGDNLTPTGWQAYLGEEGTTTKGVEIELDGQLTDNWQLAGGYTYSVSTDSNDKRIATQIPRNSFKAFTTYQLPAPLDKLTLGGGVNWQSKTGVDLGYYQQSSYAITNLMARYAIDEHFTLGVNVDNVFDRSYYSTTSAGVYGAPRSVTGVVKYTY